MNMGWKIFASLTSLFFFLTPVVAQDTPEIGSSIKIIESAVEPGVSRSNLISSQNNHYQAFTVCLPKPGVDGCAEALFIEEVASGRVYQVQGVPLEWRPFSNLIWISEKLLVFERWSNPNFGTRYTIDLNLKKLISVTPISN